MGGVPNRVSRCGPRTSLHADCPFSLPDLIAAEPRHVDLLDASPALSPGRTRRHR